jgi:flagellar basal body-associated protein FliL
MAEAKEKPEQPAKEAAPAAKSGKAPVKMIGVVAALMMAEAAGVYALVGMSGSRAQTAAAEIKGEDKAELSQPVEIELVDDKFQNMQSGRIWIWDTQIVLKVRKKNQPFIEEELEKRSAEIKEGVAQIMRRAQHSHLREPELTTLNRQLTAYLDKIFGPDADGNTRLERVLIPKCKGFQLEQ